MEVEASDFLVGLSFAVHQIPENGATRDPGILLPGTPSTT